MKVLTKRVLALVLTCAMLSVCALAADFYPLANDLNTLGLFEGKGNDADGNPNYALDDAPTRAEAITMLVRLLGKEAEAKAGTWENKFEDLTGGYAWAAPYVGYAFANELTTGETATKFGPGAPCTVQMYSTFVLRALGYSDKADGDFSYAEAVEYATKLALTDPVTASGTFLRDNVVAMSFAALFSTVNGTENSLLEKLVADGAVKAESVPLVVKKFEVFAELDALMNAQTIDSSMEVELDAEMVMSMAGADMPMTMTGVQKTKVDAQTQKAVMSMTMNMVMMGMDIQTDTYIADGYAYTSSMGQKIKMPVDMAGASGIDMSAMGDIAQLPVYMLSDAVKTTDKGVDYYSIGLPGKALMAMGGEGLLAAGGLTGTEGMEIGHCVISFAFDKGILVGMGVQTTMAMVVEEVPTTVSMDMTMVITATGDKVVIEVPADLDTYVEAPAQ